LNLVSLRCFLADPRLSAPVRAKLAAAAPYLVVVEPVVRVALDAPVRLDRTNMPHHGPTKVAPAS